MYSNQVYSNQVYSNQSSVAGSSLNSGVSKPEKNGNSSWYVAMSKAWGAALDKQADKIVSLSKGLSESVDSPAAAIRLSTEAHKFTFLSTAASTASTSAGQALETLAKKQ